MEKSKIDNLNPKEYTHLPHAEQDFDAHEQTDVAIRPLVVTLVALVLTVVVSLVGIWGLFKVFENYAAKALSNQPLSNVKPGIRQVPTDYPELQGIPVPEANPNSPAEDMTLMRARTAEVLAGKAPMRNGLQPGLPIEQAMEEALAKGIFKTSPTTAPTGGGKAK